MCGSQHLHPVLVVGGRDRLMPGCRDDQSFPIMNHVTMEWSRTLTEHSTHV